MLDAETGQHLHAKGYVLGALPTPHAAAYVALVRAIELVIPLGPSDVEIRVSSQALINQITDAEPIDIDDVSLIPLYEQAAASLLRLDIWKLRAADRKANRFVAELAQRALEAGADVEQTPQACDAAAAVSSTEAQINTRVAVPVDQSAWTVELLDEPDGDCPANCHTGIRYAFGPVTPAGFCVHAARAALNDGPLTWDDPAQKQLTTLCPECRVPLRIAVVE